MAEVRRQLEKAFLTKEEGGEDERGFLNMLLRNIVKNLEITLKNVFLLAEDEDRFIFDMKINLQIARFSHLVY